MSVSLTEYQSNENTIPKLNRVTNSMLRSDEHVLISFKMILHIKLSL